MFMRLIIVIKDNFFMLNVLTFIISPMDPDSHRVTLTSINFRERTPGEGNLIYMVEFNNFTKQNNLIVFPLIGRKFT